MTPAHDSQDQYSKDQNQGHTGLIEKIEDYDQQQQQDDQRKHIQLIHLGWKGGG